MEFVTVALRKMGHVNLDLVPLVFMAPTVTSEIFHVLDL